MTTPTRCLLALALLCSCDDGPAAPPPAVSPAPAADAPAPAADAPAPAADAPEPGESPTSDPATAEGTAAGPIVQKPGVEPPWLPAEPRTLDPQVQQASALVLAGQAAEGKALLDARIAAAPGDAEARYWRGRALAASQDLVGAEAELRQAVALDAAWFGARQELIDLLVGTRRCGDAVPLLQAQVDAHPELPQTWTNLGFCKMRSDDALGGLADLRKGCSLGYGRACEMVASAEARGAPPATP